MDRNHPIHFHFVNAQILSRQPFDVQRFRTQKGQVRFTGPARGHDRNELGYKETVRQPHGVHHGHYEV